ncbi:MAG: inner-rane translocator [Frankiales bacterium]|nr:inner-rane translocator [Frankiales bacterium]
MSVVAAARTRGGALVAPFARQLGLAGSVLLVICCFLPWSTYSGFPGKMLNSTPGGARLYVLLLALFGFLFVKDLPGRRRALGSASTFAFVIALLTMLFIAYAGRGLVNVGSGAFVGVVAALLYMVGARSLPEDDRTAPVRSLPDGRWRAAVESVLCVLAAVAALAAFVIGLGIPSTSIADGEDYRLGGAISLNDLTNESQFLSFLLFLCGLMLALSRMGVIASLGAITKRHSKVLVAAGLMAAVVFPFTQGGDGYSLRIAASIGVFAAAAVGLNIVVGLAGLLDLGYIAFFGVGAYFAAIVSGSITSVIDVHLPFGLVILLSALIAGLFGVLLGAPTLRLRGDYLAIVTLGFGEIFRITVNNLDGSAGPKLTNGPNGVSNIPDLVLPGGFSFGENHNLFGVDLPFQANYYWLEVILVAVVMTAFLRLAESRIGRAWVAIREDELAAAATGINTTRLKLLAFALGATLAGAAGSVSAHVVKVAAPDSFTFLESALLLAAVILGGMGTVQGALLGATVLYLLPEKLRFLQDLRLLVFGIVLVLIMRLRPEGLVPSKRRQREFHEAGGGADALAAPPGHAGALG